MTRSVGMTIAARAIQIISGFVGTVITARFLGPTARGEYFFVTTTTLVVVQFANLGLHSSNTYRVARDRALLPALTANSFWTALVLGSGGAALSVGLLRLTNWFPSTHPNLLWFAVALAPAILFFMLGTNLLVGAERIASFNVFEMIGNLSAVVALVSAGLAAAGVSGFLLASCAAWGVSSILLLVHLVRSGAGDIRFRREVLLTGIRYSLKAYIVAALGYLVLRANVFLLQRFYGARELGYYSIAAQVGDALTIFPTSVALVLFPRLVRDPGGRWAATVKSCAIVAALLALVCGVAALLAGAFIRVAFGPSFVPAATVLRLLLPGVFALGSLTVLSQYLAAIGVPRVTLAIWAVGLVSVLGFGRWLVPGHAGAGAAAALSITYGLLFVLLAAAAYRFRAAAGPPDEAQPLELGEAGPA